jgi:hypothetical protein
VVQDGNICYGPLSCPAYKAGPKRKVPGRHGMSYEEKDGLTGTRPRIEVGMNGTIRIRKDALPFGTSPFRSRNLYCARERRSPSRPVQIVLKTVAQSRFCEKRTE